MRLNILYSLIFSLVSVNGQNLALFWNLYEAVAQGSRIIHDITEGVGAVSKAIAAIDSFLDISAVDQITESLAEKSGTEETVTGEVTESPTVTDPTPPTEEEVPKFSGCGALGFHIRDDNIPVEKLTLCCGVHDECYSSGCRPNKRQCDSKLRTCLFSVCDDKTLDRNQSKSCRAASKLLFSGTMVLSNQQYADTQKRIGCSK